MKAWRNIEKLVPSTDDEVLVYSTSQGYQVATFHDDIWSTDHYVLDDVIYWMPIPILPNE